MKIGLTTINDCKIGSTNVNYVYIGETLVWQRESPVALIRETLDILDEAIILGYTLPSNDVINAMNLLIINMIASGYWDKQDIIYNWIYNDTALHNFGMINWKNPSGTKAQSTPTNLTMDVYGFEATGSNYILTNFNPSINGVNYQNNNASRTYLVHRQPTIGSGCEGNDLGSNGTANATAANQRINSITNMGGGNLHMATVGMHMINRTSSTNIRLFTNGTFFDRTQTSTGLPNSVQTVFRNVINSNARLSMYAMGSSITDSELGDLKTSYNTYIAAIGLTPFA